jgi:hypothetical protein
MSWIHHRYVIAGGRCVSDGITTSDITSQTNGPYAAADFHHADRRFELSANPLGTASR